MPDQVLREQEKEINQAIILIHPALSQSPVLNRVKAEQHLNKLNIILAICKGQCCSVFRQRDGQKIQMLDVIGSYLQLFKIQIYNKQPQALRLNNLFNFYDSITFIFASPTNRLNV